MKKRLGGREIDTDTVKACVNRRHAERRGEFAELIGEHGEALGKYCRFLTGSRAEGEDLLQETWLKAWSAFRVGESAWNRTYLRNVAYHAWIDRMRKGRDDTGPDTGIEAAAVDSREPLVLWPAAELLVHVLTPDQRTVYLLMEYLRFTAAETAELLDTTEGGVKASLHRARKKLDECRKSERERIDGWGKRPSEDEQAIFAYMEAIRLQDVRALLVLRNGGSGEEAALAIRCTSAERPNRTERIPKGPDPRRGIRAVFACSRLLRAA